MDLQLFGLAIAPGLAIAFYVFYRDKYEREPIRLLVGCFLLGAFSAAPVLGTSFSVDLLRLPVPTKPLSF
jgi:protease PrsW